MNFLGTFAGPSSVDERRLKAIEELVARKKKTLQARLEQREKVVQGWLTRLNKIADETGLTNPLDCRLQSPPCSWNCDRNQNKCRRTSAANIIKRIRRDVVRLPNSPERILAASNLRELSILEPSELLALRRRRARSKSPKRRRYRPRSRSRSPKRRRYY